MDAAAARTSSTLTWLAAAFGCAACALVAEIGSDARWLGVVGAAIVRAGSIPHAIPYAAAPSIDWNDAPALGQLVFHALQAGLGDTGLLVAQVAAVGTALALVGLDMRRAQARDGVGAIVLMALLVADPGGFLIVRAQLFSLALFPLLVLLLRTEARRPSHRIWLAPPLVALWANLHGGVLLGFAVLAAYLVLHRVRHARASALGVLTLSGGALLATPALLHTVAYYTTVLRGQAAASHYGLWAHLSLRSGLDVLFLVVAVPLVAAALRRRPDAWEVVVLVALAALSVEARRNGLWLLLYAATPAARSFGARSAGLILRRRLTLVCACVPVAMLGLGLAHPRAQSGASSRLLAQAALAAERTPILADPLDAEMLAQLGTRIWIGNPLDAFAADEQRAYLDWLRGRPGGDRALAPVRTVVVLEGSEPQLRLAHEGAFRELARDGRAVLYGRRD